MLASLLGGATYFYVNQNKSAAGKKLEKSIPDLEDGFVPNALSPYYGRQGPPQRSGVTIRLPLPPNPQEQHLLIPEIIVTPEYTMAYKLISRSVSEIENEDIKLDPVFTGDSNNYSVTGKHITKQGVIESLLYNYGANSGQFYRFRPVQ